MIWRTGKIGGGACPAAWNGKWRQGRLREGKIGELNTRREQSNLSSTEVIQLLNSYRGVIDGSEPCVTECVLCM